MLRKEKYRKILKGRMAAGVECELLSAGEFRINYVVLQEKRNRVEIVSSGKKLSTTDELKKALPKGIPVLLVLDGKGIINRRLDESSEGDEAKLLNSVFPNASAQDFYLHHIEGYDRSGFISVMRKQAADEWVDQFSRAGIEVIHCTPGPFCINTILPLLKEENLRAGRYQFTVLEGKPGNFIMAETTEKQSYMIGEDSLDHDLLIPFSAALIYFSQAPLSSPVASANPLFKEFIQKRLFVFSGSSCVMGLLLLLLINYFLFQRFSSQYALLSESISANENVLQHYDTLKKQVETKKQFLENRGLLHTSRTSWYSDQVAYALPANIRLERMNICPLVTKSGDEENELSFAQQTMTIAGNCKKSSELNAWIKQLQSMKWVNKVTLLHYEQDKAADNGSFTLQIDLA